MLEQLDQWASSIPQTRHNYSYIRTTCELRYYSIRILLLRPSPAIPRPSTESLIECYDLSWRAVHLYDQLYRQDMLVHDWVSLHGIIFCTITALYCIRAVPEMARTTELDELMNNLSVSLSLVSVTGERWSGAKRSRQILDDIGRSTIKWMKSLKSSTDLNLGYHAENPDRAPLPPTINISTSIPMMSALSTNNISGTNSTNAYPSTTPLGMSLEDRFWADPPQQFDFGDITNVDNIMRNLFDDFIPQMNSTYH